MGIERKRPEIEMGRLQCDGGAFQLLCRTISMHDDKGLLLPSPFLLILEDETRPERRNTPDMLCKIREVEDPVIKSVFFCVESQFRIFPLEADIRHDPEIFRALVDECDLIDLEADPHLNGLGNRQVHCVGLIFQSFRRRDSGTYRQEKDHQQCSVSPHRRLPRSPRP